MAGGTKSLCLAVGLPEGPVGDQEKEETTHKPSSRSPGENNKGFGNYIFILTVLMRGGPTGGRRHFDMES